MSMLLKLTRCRKNIHSTRVPALLVLLVLGAMRTCFGQSVHPTSNQLVPGSTAYLIHARVHMINIQARLLYPGSFAQFSNAYRAIYNEQGGISDARLPQYTMQQVQWIMKEMRTVRGMTVGHYCERLDCMVGCVDRARLTSEQQYVICTEVAQILPTLPTGTDHPLPVCIAEMFANLHYYQALPEVKALLPKYSPQHDADYSWDTSEARLRSAISKLKSAKASHTGPVQGPTSRDEAPSHR